MTRPELEARLEALMIEDISFFGRARAARESAFCHWLACGQTEAEARAAAVAQMELLVIVEEHGGRLV